MPKVTFADVVQESIAFTPGIPAHALVLRLIDSAWFQRLRDISQTANTRLVYMFSEHSRFGHSLGVASLATLLMDKLALEFPKQVEKHRLAVSAAALLHDIGHLAPGSHMAYRTWFPDAKDAHEEVATRILSEDRELSAILNQVSGDLALQVSAILRESKDLPAWTWQIISGGGWNVDRGNWCILDSIMAGVSYGKYNIPALTDSIIISEDGQLALRENRLDAMLHFALSRHALYRQIYQHRVLLAADCLNSAIVKRARALSGKLPFCDEHMQAVLKASGPDELSLDNIFWMREAWWRYHLALWSKSQDSILSDLSQRLLNRHLFKTVRIRSSDEPAKLFAQARECVERAGFDPEYYLFKISTFDTQAGDQRQSMAVELDDGRITAVTELDPLFEALLGESRFNQNSWIALPAEAKKFLGRTR